MASPDPDLIAELRAAGCVFAEDEARLLTDAAGTPRDLGQLVERRVSGLPLEHILGWAEFCGLRIAVDPEVFVPRKRTEFLAEQARKLARPGVAVDLCCGTGAIAAVLATTMPHLDVYATDIDLAAVRCARRNVVPAGGQVCQGDLYDALPERLRGEIRMVVANAPYVPTEAIAMMPPEARVHEARIALDGGEDGLDLHRRIAAGAREWLRPGGQLLIETSERQAPQTTEAMARHGLRTYAETSDDYGTTVVIGTAPA